MTGRIWRILAVRVQEASKAANCKRSAGENKIASPIPLAPIENFRMNHCEEPTDNGPSPRYPRHHHPANRRAGESSTKPHPDYRMGQNLAKSENESLTRRILGSVSRLLDDMKRLEMLPHWMWRGRSPPLWPRGCSR